MNYPLISEYVEAIKAAEDNFDQLKHLRPVLDDDGMPVMSGGNFAVVFKMKDEQTGKLHAVKCFLKEQEGRAEAYRQIAEELEYVSSTFLTPIKYLDKELFVDSANSEDSEFPVLLMDWVEGQTLDKYIREHIDDQYELSLLAYQFSRLAMWLMPQPFAHGDLKPDNILVKEDGALVLVDYDGMYVPAMKGQKARELGSPDFRHPSRTEEVFDDHIDDFSLASILLSLKAIALQPSLLEEYGASDRLLFSEKDYRNLSESSALGALQPLMQDAELASLYSLYILALSQNNLSQVSFRLFNLNRPKEPELTEEDLDAWAAAMEEERAPYDIAVCWMFRGFVKGYKKVYKGCYYCSFTGGGEDALAFERENGERTIVYNLNSLSTEQINENRDNLSIELRRSGEFFLCNSSLGGIIENDSSLISSETWDGSFPNDITDNKQDKTAEYNFENSWSLIEFADLHGKMQVEQRKNKITGEEFSSLCFVDEIGREIHALIFDNMGNITLNDLLNDIGNYRIGAAPSQYFTPSYYYLYNKTFDFWLPGMSI